MSTLRISVSVAASTVALLCATTSFAQDKDLTDPVAPQPPPAPLQQPAGQPQPTYAPPVVTPDAPPAQPDGVTPVAPQPTSVTATTQATLSTTTENDRVDLRPDHHRPYRPLLATGLSLFGATYATSVIVGGVSDRDADKRLFIPGIGPWLDLGQRNCSTHNCGDNETVDKAFIIASGAVQGIGISMAIASLFIPEKNHYKSAAALKIEEKPSMHVLPVSFAGGGGVGAVGRF